MEWRTLSYVPAEFLKENNTCVYVIWWLSDDGFEALHYVSGT